MRVVLAGVMAAMLGTAANAQVGLDEFQHLCMDHKADRIAALAAADASGWMPVPKAMMDKFPTGSFKDPEARMRSTKEALLLMFVGHGNPGGGAVQGADLQICGVGVLPALPDGFEKDAADLSGVEKFGDSHSAMFFWREEGGKHVKLEMTDMAPAVNAKTFNMIMTLQSEKLSMIMLAASASADQSGAAPH